MISGVMEARNIFFFGVTVQRAKSTILGQGARFTWVSISQFGQETSMVSYGMGGKRGEASSKNEMMALERRHMRMGIW